MENKIQIFNNPEFGKIRSLMIDNEPYFVGKDVAKALGYAKTENAIATHVDEEDKTSTLIQGSGSNYRSMAIIINESGVYSLIFGSKLPTAKKFKQWVTGVVLPSIRKTGRYNINSNNKGTLERQIEQLQKICEQQNQLIQTLLPSVTNQIHDVQNSAQDDVQNNVPSISCLNYSGDIIRNMREQSDVTQNELSRRLNVVRSYISKVENGGCIPNTATFFKIADVLNFIIYMSKK